MVNKSPHLLTPSQSHLLEGEPTSNQKILSIGILSYNQIRGLRKTFDSITEMFNSSPTLGQYIEIIVSDNSSTDDSMCLINEFEFASIKLFQHQNIGFHGNLIKVLTNMNCEIGIVIGCGEALNVRDIEIFVQWILANPQTVSSPNLVSGVSSGKESKPTTSSNSGVSFGRNGPWVDPAIGLNIWKPKLLSSIDLENLNETWTHYDLILRLKKMQKDSFHLNCDLNLVEIDQPTSGWYSSPDYLKVILELQDLVFTSSHYDSDIGNSTASLSQQYQSVGSMIIHNRTVYGYKVSRAEISRLRDHLGIFSTGFLYLVICSYAPIKLAKLLRRLFSFDR